MKGTTAWTKKTLYTFKGGADGRSPSSGVTLASDGSLTGETESGGKQGTVFKLMPPAAGITAWTEKVLYTFKGGTDGIEPISGLTAAKSGTLYGITIYGGSNGCQAPGTRGGCGTVFSLKP